MKYRYNFKYNMEKKEPIPDNEKVAYVPFSIMKYGTKEVVYASHFLYFEENEKIKVDPFEELPKLGFTPENILNAIKDNKDTILGNIPFDKLPDPEILVFMDWTKGYSEKKEKRQ